MPGGIRLLSRTEAEMLASLPPAGTIQIFSNQDQGDAPYTVDSAGNFLPLQGLPGADGELTYLDHGNTGATETVDVQVANIQRLVANAATVTLTLSNPPASGTPGVVRLLLEQDGSGGRDWAFPGSVDWGTPGEPVWTSRVAGDIDVVDLTTVDGGTSYIAAFVPDATAAGTLDTILAASSGEDIADALSGAAAPDAGNVFATMADVGGGTPGFVGCTAYHSTTESFLTTATRAALLDSDEIDTDNYHYTSAANLTGTVAKTATSPNIVGTGTSFTTELGINQVIVIPGTAAEIGVVKAITDNTHLELWQTMANSASGQTATRQNQYAAVPAGKAGKHGVAGSSFINGYSGTATSNIAVSRNGVVLRGTRTTMPIVAAYWTSGYTIVDCAEGDYFAVVLANNSSATQLLGNALAEAQTGLVVQFLGA